MVTSTRNSFRRGFSKNEMRTARRTLSWLIMVGAISSCSAFSAWKSSVPMDPVSQRVAQLRHPSLPLSMSSRQPRDILRTRGPLPPQPPTLGDKGILGLRRGSGQPRGRWPLHRLFFASNAYLEYLDHVSGKAFRSSFPMPTNTTAAEEIPGIKRTLLSISEKGDGMLGRVASPALVKDIQRRRKVYASDWTDAFKKPQQVIPAILFLYFACLSPAISFGTIASQITNGSMGIVEFLLSCGLSGMAYAVLSGQPMAFVAPTGLTLAFISGLFRYCTLKGLPFFPTYAWVGIWTSSFMVFLGMAGSSQLIRYCTRFTDEIFNGLLSVNFIYEALSSLRRNFVLADPMNLTMPFVSLGMAWATFWSTMGVTGFDRSKFFNARVRKVVKNFGPVTIFVLLTMLNHHPWLSKFGVPTLSVPDSFQLAGGRSFRVALNTVPTSIKLLCSLPAMLLTSLFFMDQNISVRVVNNPENKLKKGSAYNLDMVALGIITFALSIVGLPWMCGATVQSMNHVRAMTETKFNEETGDVEIAEVTETRLTGFVMHAMIVGTLGLLPLLRSVPIPVVSGVFLFLGRKLMSGNSFLQRIRDSFSESSRLPDGHPIRMIGRQRAGLFTAIQAACLAGLWSFKQNSATAIFFPSVIGLLMLVRSFVLPRIFTQHELVELGEQSTYS